MQETVIKGSSYILAHTPNTLKIGGTTQTQARNKDSESEYLKKIDDYLRDFSEAVRYAPTQCYIGNILPDDLKDIERPWYKEDNFLEDNRYGKRGEIMPEDEFYGLVQFVDVFDLVKLEEEFVKEIEPKLKNHPVLGNLDMELKGLPGEKIEEFHNGGRSEPLYLGDRLVGVVKGAHESDENLSAHVIMENLMSKAGGVLALLHLGEREDVNLEDIEYVIECSEEACGDMNQRGGGNFAKAIAEKAGCINATGSDTRGFCAGPAHSLINAAALVKAGVYEQVAVVAGGAVAKLGMNGKDNVKKETPILEDTLGGFAVLVTADDGVSPILRTDALGKHTVGKGSSPQAVISALVTDGLEKAGLKMSDVDKYSVEMQNPEMTEPAGAGNVPEANYKMIAALGVKRGDIERKDLMKFVEEHGMPGFAPTQGHIPSGVPFIGPAAEMMAADKLNRAMIIGKGSLFLARMTNQFDGVSFLMEKNTGQGSKEETADREEIKSMIAQAMRGMAESLSVEDKE